MKVLYEVRNIMKKTICLGIVLSFLIVFFSFNVSAQGITFADSAYNSQVVSGVTANITVTRYYPNNEGTAAVPGSTYLPYMVYIQIYNNNDSAALVNSLRANITFSNNGWIPQIYNVENFSSDLTLSFDGDTVGCRVSPSGSFSYGNGIVVPPKQSLYLIAEVQIRCDWAQTNTSDPYTYPTLDTVSCGNFTVGLGGYTYGSPVDLSSVITILNNIDLNTDDISNIYTILNSIRNPVSSNIVQDTFNPYTRNVTLYSDANNQVIIRAYAEIENYISSFYESVDQLSGYTTRIAIYDCPVRIRYRIVNNTSKAYSYTPYYKSVSWTMAEPGFTSGGYYIEKNVHDHLSVPSTTKTSIYVEDYLHYNNSRGLILPHEVTELDYTYHYIYIDYDYSSFISSNSINLANFTFSSSLSNSITATEVSGYENYDYNVQIALGKINTNLYNFYSAYSSINGTGDVSTGSGSVQSQSESNHAIEESYYSANSDAILATGLSNYRFSNDQSNGIAAVSNDFTAVWNALSSYNSVYIFSLTLSIALMIFRHVPGVISRKLRSRNNGDE